MKKRILIIDDEKTIQLLLEHFLSSKYDVETKSSGIEGMEWLKQNLPDLIISDIQMEEMNGFEFLKEVRMNSYMKHTPIVMLSGKTESKERVKCYQLGAQDYLTKPFNPQELEEVIKKNLYPIHYSNNW